VLTLFEKTQVVLKVGFSIIIVEKGVLAMSAPDPDVMSKHKTQ